jgi:hypothetical protein
MPNQWIIWVTSESWILLLLFLFIFLKIKNVNQGRGDYKHMGRRYRRFRSNFKVISFNWRHYCVANIVFLLFVLYYNGSKINVYLLYYKKK